MKLTATNLLLPLLLLLSWLVGGAVEAQTPTTDYAFWLMPSVPSCTAGSEITIDLFLQISPTAPVSTPLQAFTVGVCHDTSLLALIPSTVVMGNWISSLQPCNMPDFLEVSEWGGTTGSAGYTIGTLFSFLGTNCTLPVGCHHIATAEYSCASDAPLDSSAISTCNTLGVPPVATVVIFGGTDYTPQSEFISGDLSAECSYPAPDQMLLNWTTSDAFDYFEIFCDGVVVASLPGTETSYIHFCDSTAGVCCIVRGIICGVAVESDPCCCVAGVSCAIDNPTITCGSATTSDEFTVTFDVVNNSGFDVTKLVIPGLVGGVSVSPNVIDLATPLPDTGILTGVQLFLNGGNAGDVVCIPVGLLAKDDAGNLFECCGTEVCVELPACCLTISSQGFTVDAGGNITYNFNITNESGEAPVVAEHLFTSILSPSNVTLSTDWFALNGLADGDPPITLTNTIIGAQAGDEVCFQITMHDASLSECCGVVICHTVPGNPVPPCIPELICEPVGDANGDGVSDVLLTWPIPANDECCVGDMVIEVNGALIASVNPFTGTALVDCVDGTYCLVCNDVSGNQTIQACCDVACIPFAPPPPEFLRGDANSDGAFDISDVISSLDYLFQGQSVPCLVALDSNDDETVDIGDTIFSLEALFGGGPSPWPPYQQCGVDETSGNLGCEYFPACEGNDSSPNGG